MGEPAALDVLGKGFVTLQLVILAIAFQEPRALFVADANT